MTTSMGRLKKDTVWEGEVCVTGDVLIPPGTTLRIRPGTRVSFAERARWSCSVFWRSREGSDSVEATVRDLCGLVVAGRLEIDGTAEAPVRLGGSTAWGGISCIGTGRAALRRSTVVGAPQFSLQAFDDASIEGSDSHCRRSEFGLWARGTSRISWRGGAIDASRGSVLCCEGSRAHLVSVRDESGEGVAATDWSLIRVDRGHFQGPRKHCVVARHRSWVKLTDCKMQDADALMDIVRLDEAHVQVRP